MRRIRIVQAFLSVKTGFLLIRSSSKRCKIGELFGHQPRFDLVYKLEAHLQLNTADFYPTLTLTPVCKFVGHLLRRDKIAGRQLYSTTVAIIKNRDLLKS